MSLEKNLWRYLSRGMAGKWHATRHENAISQGLPDVSYGMNGVQGWIELKVLSAWPKRNNTPVKIQHFTIFQMAWLKERGTRGGRCFLLLKVEREYLLLDYKGIDLIGKANKKELIKGALLHCSNRLDFQELARALG